MRASFRQIGAEFVARNKVAYRVNTTIPGHTLAFGNGNKFVGNGVLTPRKSLSVLNSGTLRMAVSMQEAVHRL
jgi:hypothetical protein